MMATRVSRGVAFTRSSRFIRTCRTPRAAATPLDRGGRRTRWTNGVTARANGRSPAAAHDRTSQGAPDRHNEIGSNEPRPGSRTIPRWQRREAQASGSTWTPAIDAHKACHAEGRVGGSVGGSLAPAGPIHKRKRPASRTGRRRLKRRLWVNAVNYCGVRVSRNMGGYAINPFSRCRAITMRWISLVPSPISQILASRMNRSTG